jgi:DNA-binding NarL/FixJ family response regulator
MRVMIVDDTLLIRSGIAALLMDVQVDVVASAANSADALHAVAWERPDAAIIDIRMPPTYSDEGLVLAQRVRRDFPAVAVLVLSQYLESSYALRLLGDSPGSVGYLLKDRLSSASTLVDALRRIIAGECVVDPEIVRRLFGKSRSRGPLSELTERETEVLSLMAEGHSNQALSLLLHLSSKTVETHIGRVFGKLGLSEDEEIHRRVLAVLAYLRYGAPRLPGPPPSRARS